MRTSRGQLPAEAKRDRAPAERINVQTDLHAEPGPRQLAKLHPATIGERRIVGRKPWDGSVQVDDQEGYGWRRLLRAGRTGGDDQEHHERRDEDTHADA